MKTRTRTRGKQTRRRRRSGPRERTSGRRSRPRAGTLIWLSFWRRTYAEPGTIPVEWDPYTFSILTEESGTVVFQQKRHPSEMRAAEISMSLSWLAESRHVSASTQNQALSALMFLYRDVLQIDVGRITGLVAAKVPHRLPVVLTRAEVSRLLQALNDPFWLIAALLYGAGLRLNECLELRIKDSAVAASLAAIYGDRIRRHSATGWHHAGSRHAHAGRDIDAFLSIHPCGHTRASASPDAC
ncbi:MAG: phage integrase N-terminal SAM-like domain-containing protein [Vicinamibacterales bacterium]